MTGPRADSASDGASDSAITRLRDLFMQAVELAPGQRATFLAELARDDPAIAEKLAALIDADARLTQRPTAPLLPVLQALRNPDALWVGRRVGRWRLTRELGAGGMGAVFLGEPLDAGDTAPVAVKLMHAWLVDPHTRQRFLRERQVLAKLSHPLIARYVDAGEEDGTLYAAMEYVDGEPLLVHADRKRLTLRERIGLFLKVCAAVAHAHSHLVIHRDIKSSNLLVNADGLPKLLDFGIAKPLRAAAPERTATAQRVFTPHSAAPEQITGGEASDATDVYGLGVLLYELLCGELPLSLAGLSPGQIENTILGVEPLAPSQRIFDAPANIADARARLRGLPDRDALAQALYDEIDGVVLMALRKDAADRYPSVDAFAADLRRANKEHPTEAARTLRWRRAVSAMTGRRAVVAFGVAALVAIALGMGAWLTHGGETAPAASTAEAASDETLQPAPIVDAQADVPADPETLLAQANVQMQGGRFDRAPALVDRALAAIEPDDANVDLRVRLFDAKAAALVALADFPAANATLDAGLRVAVTRRHRALLELRRIALLDARGRTDEATAAARALEPTLQALPADDALASRIRARLDGERPRTIVAATPAAALKETDCVAALAGETGLDPAPETLRRFTACVAHAESGVDAATRFAMHVAYGRLLNRAGDYTGAAQVLEAAIEAARADPALRSGDTQRVAALAAAIANYGRDGSDSNRERVRNELAGANWLDGDAGRAEWNEQRELARKLGVAPKR